MKGRKIADGRTAEIFEWGGQQIVKLFRLEFSEELAEHEFKLAQAITKTGLPVPEAERLVEVDRRKGIVYRRFEGPTMLQAMASKPWTVFRFAALMAELHACIHGKSIPGLPDIRQRLGERIWQNRVVPSHLKDTLLARLNRLPDGESLCHNDFHPNNIIISPAGPIVIDWLDATRGHPMADVARTSLLMDLARIPPGVRGRRLIEVLRSSFHRRYLREYMKIQSGKADEIRPWLGIVAAARMAEGIEGETGRLLSLAQTQIA
jgi:aminoglycoside phosphotransferase (APT) family kinase protein